MAEMLLYVIGFFLLFLFLGRALTGSFWPREDE